MTDINVTLKIDGRELARYLADTMSAQIVREGAATRDEQRRGAAAIARRLNDEGSKVLELALREALSAGHNYVGPEHIRAALTRMEEAE